MRLLGYGEDALTLWAIQDRLAEIMSKLGDDLTNVHEVFFRPSFGRRSVGRAGLQGPQFGEFDAIIVSREGVYLVEAKWTGSGELAHSNAVLRDEQLRRHLVFREYLKHWRLIPYETWSRFAAAVPHLTFLSSGGEEAMFAVARLHTRLAANLEFILRSCAKGGPRVIDVLLAIHPSGHERKYIAPSGFTCVELVGPPVDGNYVVLEPNR